MKLNRLPEITMMSTNRLSRRIDFVHSRALRAHRLLAPERLALAPKAIGSTTVSLEALLAVLPKSLPRIQKLRGQFAAAVPAFDLALLDRLPLYALDFFYYSAMADLARALGPDSPDGPPTRARPANHQVMGN